MEYLILFLAAIFCGILSSTPPGPINLLIADHIFSGKRIQMLPFLSGIIIADVFYALLAFLGYYILLEGTDFGYYMAAVGGVVLALFGGFTLYQVLTEVGANDNLHSNETPHLEGFKLFFKGLLLCGTNPGFFVFWVAIAAQFKEYGFSDLSPLNLSLIVLGITLGDLLWFMGYIKVLRRSADKLSTKFVKYLRLIISVVLVCLGIVALVSAIV